ncbi:hypothetical protein HLRTI_001204 [Halorhabdus tiamatea SARL4B]|uniref:Ribbon-helix-helix protein CopG domain-containing protein n=1 Tax=Halorhabdus tiamatea SARL4B TaxID=1033806 RepID=F7PHH1_9EURY|nr:hypothetical protein [Halorhabdus tiamatea]ERJ06788.1 hypothetical protein HLRTI_001204 [Halorhabdus tiamatea SARL4B]CCQ33711.1 conserved hypothetical protein [Halorhabdus tiamatea SARL4B]
MAADSDHKRVHFLSPEDLVERADALAEIMDTDRTDVINEALQEFLDERTDDEDFQQRVAEAYYDDRIDRDLVEALVGAERARTFELLKADLESDPLDVPEPDESVDIYDGETVEVDPTE